MPSSNQKSKADSTNSDDKTNSSRSSIQSETAPLASREFVDSDNTISDSLLKLLRIRKRSLLDSLDGVATQPSVYDGPLASNYTPRLDWENIKNFDPLFRW